MMPNRLPDEVRPVEELPPLAEAKLVAPRQRRGMVRRARIDRALEAGADMPVTLVVAPAGYGKTTAVRNWSEGSPAALAWVTLDGLDNDLRPPVDVCRRRRSTASARVSAVGR